MKEAFPQSFLPHSRMIAIYHYNYSGVTWAPVRLKSRETLLFDKALAYVDNKETIKRPHDWAPSQYKDRLIYVWWFPC